jgi:hypothetical protein
MSYNLKWALSGLPVFSVGRIDVDSNRPSIGSFASGRTSYYLGAPEMMTISLRDCVTINTSVLENLRSYMNIPFPIFYLVEHNNKTAIRIGDHSTSSVWLTDFNITTATRSTGSFSLKLITSTPLEYIVCPEVKIDHMEIKVAVAEKIPSRQIVVCKK